MATAAAVKQVHITMDEWIKARTPVLEQDAMSVMEFAAKAGYCRYQAYVILRQGVKRGELRRTQKRNTSGRIVPAYLPTTKGASRD